MVGACVPVSIDSFQDLTDSKAHHSGKFFFRKVFLCCCVCSASAAVRGHVVVRTFEEHLRNLFEQLRQFDL